MATSTILSPSTYDFSMNFKPEAQGSMVTSQQRPKLSLNTTASKRSFGKNNTGLRLDTISDASPTTRNTTQNTLGLASESTGPETFRMKPRKPLFPRLQTSGLPEAAPQQPDALQIASPVDTAQSSAQASRTSSPARPYSLPVEIRSILLNGPISKRERPVTTPISARLPSEIAKDRSPTTKKVCFRDPVEEDIKNAKYLLRHSDLRSRSSSPAPPISNPAVNALSQMPPPRARELAPKTDDSTGALEDDDEPSPISKTPVAGRNKKDREWKWTLGPLPKISLEGSALLRVDSHSSEEDLDDSLLESVAAAGGFQASKLEQDEDESE